MTPLPSERPYRIGVIADTHSYVPGRALEVFAGVDLILHAGDIGDESVLQELELVAPVCAVSGNIDGAPDERSRPLVRRLETPAGRIAMTHGHLPAAPAFDLPKLVRYFAPFRPAIVVFGHTHVAYLGQLDGVTLFNPGAAGRATPQRPPSVGLIACEAHGSPPRLEHVVLD